MKDLFKNYDQIILEISKDRNERDINVDKWDVLAALFMAAFVTVAALGAGWIAYSIIISISAGTIVSVGTACIEWLKVKENRSNATKYLQDFINSNFGQEIKEISMESIKIMHSKIKNKLIDLFKGEIDMFEKVINPESQ